MTNWDLSHQYKVGSKFETQYNLLVHFYFSVLCSKTCWDHTKLFFHTKILREESKLFLRETVSVQFSSVAQSCPTLCNPMNSRVTNLSLVTQIRQLP